MVDQISKMSNIVPCSTTADTFKIAQLCFQEIAHLHGFPKMIVSDCDTEFMSYFWKVTKIKLQFSGSYRPQTHGQMEVASYYDVVSMIMYPCETLYCSWLSLPIITQSTVSHRCLLLKPYLVYIHASQPS